MKFPTVGEIVASERHPAGVAAARAPGVNRAHTLLTGLFDELTHGQHGPERDVHALTAVLARVHRIFRIDAAHGGWCVGERLRGTRHPGDGAIDASTGSRAATL